MGNTDNKIEVEKAILRHPTTGEASGFYWACRHGDLERVKQILPTIEFNKLNCLEPNGSTALHTACYCGHTEIVRLLLCVRGCKRDQRNRYGLTAYEESYSDEIRQLFHRPQGSGSRFCDEENDISDMFDVKTDTSVGDILGDEEAEEAPNDEWIECTADDERFKICKEVVGSVTAICNSTTVKGFMALCQSRLIKNLGNCRDEQGTYQDPWLHILVEQLKKMITEKVTNQHSAFDRCNLLIDECMASGRGEHLLRLYTLETPLCRELRKDESSLSCPLMMLIGQFQERYFQGTSYRGLTMSEDDYRTYRWALKYKGIIMLKTFCSTSLNREKAEAFASPSFGDDNRQRVLMVLQFNQKCAMAINLCKLSDELPCISEYEDEAEILVLPYTFFKVARIEIRDTLQIIYLENVALESKSFLSGVKYLYNNWGKLDAI